MVRTNLYLAPFVPKAKTENYAPHKIFTEVIWKKIENLIKKKINIRSVLFGYRRDQTLTDGDMERNWCTFRYWGVQRVRVHSQRWRDIVRNGEARSEWAMVRNWGETWA